MTSGSSANLSPMELARQATDEILATSGIECQDLDLTLDSSWAKAANLIVDTIAKNLDDEGPGFSSSGIPGHTGTIRWILLGKKRQSSSQKIWCLLCSNPMALILQQ